MDMSKAAAPPRYGHASLTDERHPLFPIYRQYRLDMTRLMVDSENFRDWLSIYEARLIRHNAAKHNQYPAFVKWMLKAI